MSTFQVFFARLSCLAAFALLCGCATTYRTTDARSTPVSQLAVLEHHNPAYSHFIISHVDGKYRGLGIIHEYQLTPGIHSIRLTAGIAIGEDRYPKPEHSLISINPVEVTFNALGGNRYVIDVSFDVDRKTWAAFIIDKSTGQIVSTSHEVKDNH